jgi:hypothetical protein
MTLNRKIYRYVFLSGESFSFKLKVFRRSCGQDTGCSVHFAHNFFTLNKGKLKSRKPGNMKAKVDAGTEDFHLQIGVLRILLRQEDLKWEINLNSQLPIIIS